MRGVTETTRGSAHYPKDQSIIVRRHASTQDLAQAQRYVGQCIDPLPFQSTQPAAPPYRCMRVRLDDLKRLIFDLRKEKQPKGKGARHAAAS